MQLVIFEDYGYRNLLPLVYSRATFNLRCGFDNLLDKIETTMHLTANALFVRDEIAAVITERQRRAVNLVPPGNDQLWINGRLLLRQALDLPAGSAAWQGETLLAARIDRPIAQQLTNAAFLSKNVVPKILSSCRTVDVPKNTAELMEYPWQLVHENEKEIVRQFAGVARDIKGRIYPGAHLINEAAIHIGAGSKIKPGVVLDAENGPIFIAHDVTIQPNTVVIGPAFIGERCLIQPGAAIRNGTSIHMGCKVGGEIEGTIFHGFSNKQHDGFLGHSYVGEWVNLGADTVNSDLKNTYGPVQVWLNGRAVNSGQMFVGCFIGDHTKTGINTAIPTGCVIGYAGNVFMSRYVPKFVPSFSWLTDEGPGINDPVRALAVAEKVVARRGRTMSPAEQSLFVSIADESKNQETAV